MPWNEYKCKWGTPAGFDNQAAQNAVNNADFTESVYVNISAEEGNTKQAYTYYGYTSCSSNSDWTAPSGW